MTLAIMVLAVLVGVLVAAATYVVASVDRWDAEKEQRKWD